MQQSERDDKRRERYHRILDVAVRLVERWGYKKTTIDDIAREAGVAKGTIYLHWKTREDLLIALIYRETMQMAGDFRASIGDDLNQLTVKAVVRGLLQALHGHPLVLNLMLGDRENFQEVSHSKLGLSSTTVKIAVLRHFFVTMREYGLVRTDQEIDQQIKQFIALCFGFLLTNLYLPEDLHLSLDEQIEGLADSLRAIFAAPVPASPENIQAIQKFFLEQFDQLLVTAQSWSPEE
jgi:AcrR family transcriptional regulator